MSNPFDIAKKLAENNRKRWEEDARSQRFHGLIIANKGDGKTTVAATLPAPVYLCSFDPGGTISIREQIKAGRVIADTRYEVDSITDPRAYMEFERNFNQMVRDKVFDSLGSFVLDTMSTMTRAAMWQIMKKENRTPPGMDGKSDDTKHNMRIQDWGTLVNVWIMWARALSTLPCHTLILGHVGREKDEALQSYVRTVAVPGQSSEQVPIHVPEFYLLKRSESPSGNKFELITDLDNEFKLSSKLAAGGRLSKSEPPNLQELIKKAGLPWEDKVLL